MKLIIILFLLSASFFATAQTKLSLTGGVNINSLGIKDKDLGQVNSDSADYTFSSKKSEQGFHLGILANIPTEENWNFETGLIFIKKGGSTKETTVLQPSNVAFSRSQTFAPHYLQIPLYLSYFPDSRKKYKFTAAAGGYVAFGVGGKYSSTSNIGATSNIKVKRDARFGIALTDDFQKIEYGIGAKMGFVMSDNLVLGVGILRSFVNNAPKVKAQNGSVLHNNITFSIAKIFRK